jgi:cytidylate kinase
MIVTIGGFAASGKTTLARRLAERLGFKHVSAGALMREMAYERKQSLMDFSRYAESHTDVDVEIDRRQKKLARGNCVVDGRLSAHFIKAGLKVWLTAPMETRARRIKKRDGHKTLKEAVRHIERREESEKKRYLRIYGIKHPDYSIYDLILDTSTFTADETAEVVATAACALRRRRR